MRIKKNEIYECKSKIADITGVAVSWNVIWNGRGISKKIASI